jgi:DNA-binding response OmpR family regulator
LLSEDGIGIATAYYGAIFRASVESLIQIHRSNRGILMAKPMPVRIVMAEDSGPDVILVKETFRAAGIEVILTVFPDGEECARYLGTVGERPDAILLDLNLPRVDGFELLRAVRGNRRYDGVPVAMLTSSRRAEDRRKSLDLGANAFITKPSTLDDFLRVVGAEIRRLLGAGGLAHAPALT